MLRLRKGDPVKTLPKALTEVWELMVQTGAGWEKIPQIRDYEAGEALMRDCRLGPPTHFSFCRDTRQHISIVPRPDRRYNIRVVGLEMVVL